MKNRILLFSSMLLVSIQLFAQHKPSAHFNKLYQFGIADAFVNGLYRGNLGVNELKAKGDFGIGAPGMLDGELTVYQGKVYQTKYTGETIVAPDSVSTALAFVTFFKADTTFYMHQPSDQNALYKALDELMENKNGMYAIRVTGDFERMKTRAFPPVDQPPYLALASMLDKQRTFTFDKVKGVLVGYRLPAYLAEVNIAGYHFHFLTDDQHAGGHALNFQATDVKVEIAALTGFSLEVPNDKDFMNYDFKNVNKPDMNRVEKGH